MARKISEKFLKSLQEGEFKDLLQVIAQDKELLLQVRDGCLKIYYKGGKILQINPTKYDISEKYFVNGKSDEGKEELLDVIRKERKYEEYFKKAKRLIDDWEKIRDRREFEVQQNVALSNQDKDGRFVVIDTEYGFSQAEIKIKKNRLSRAKFDLVAMKSNKVVFFEVKKGLDALEGKSGIISHIEDFEKFLYTHKKNTSKYQKNLKQDIKSIVSTKKSLGFLDYSLPEDFSVDDVELSFIFEHYRNIDEIETYETMFKDEYKKLKGSKKQYSTFLVGKDKYILDTPKIKIPTMTITIHRGTNQIGGCITEISSSRARIFIDIGDELPSEGKKTDIKIEGVTEGTPKCDAVFITHYHGDHVGLYDKVLPGIPIYIGATAKHIYKKLQTRCRKKNIDVIEGFETFGNKELIEIEDFTIKPIRTDHSAYDAYMFLIECNSKKILHTGDFRTHGFTGDLVLPALAKYVGEVDVLITEGTTLSRKNEQYKTEPELMEEASALMKKHKYVFVMCASTNIDRMAAFHNATPHGKYFLCDEYQKDLLQSIASSTNLDEYKFENVEFFGEISLEEMREKGFCMMVRSESPTKKDPIFRPLMKQFPDHLFIYSMWEGYLDGIAKIDDIASMVPSGYEYLHTSGHATRDAIRKVCDTVKPKIIIPIHGQSPQEFKKMGLCGDVEILTDGKSFVV